MRTKVALAVLVAGTLLTSAVAEAGWFRRGGGGCSNGRCGVVTSGCPGGHCAVESTAPSPSDVPAPSAQTSPKRVTTEVTQQSSNVTYGAPVRYTRAGLFRRWR